MAYSSPAPAQTAPFTATEIRASALDPEVRSLESRFQALARANDAAGLLAALHRLEEKQAPDRIKHARLRYAALMSFAEVSEDSAARIELERYLVRQPDVFVWHEDGPHRVAVPAFDPSAAAAYALSEWHRRAWQDRARRGIDAGSGQFLDDWLAARRASGGRLSDAGLVGAFSKADRERLAAWPARLEELLRDGAPVAGMAHVVALREGDARLAAAIVRDADTLEALRFMQAYAGTGDPETETSVLRHALAREDLASAALYRLAKLPSHEARALLLTELASPAHGSSAAAALARRTTPDLIETLSDLVATGEDMSARRRAVLALQFAHDAGGRQALQKLQRDPGLPAELRSQIDRRLP